MGLLRLEGQPATLRQTRVLPLRLNAFLEEMQCRSVWHGGRPPQVLVDGPERLNLSMNQQLTYRVEARDLLQVAFIALLAARFLRLKRALLLHVVHHHPERVRGIQLVLRNSVHLRLGLDLRLRGVQQGSPARRFIKNLIRRCVPSHLEVVTSLELFPRLSRHFLA